MLDLATLTRRDPDSAAFLDNNTRNPAVWAAVCPKKCGGILDPCGEG